MSEKKVNDIEGLNGEIDRLYRAYWHQAGENARLERAFQMHSEVIAMLRRQVEADHLGLSEREMRIKVAERLYMADPGALRLLKWAAEHE